METLLRRENRIKMELLTFILCAYGLTQILMLLSPFTELFSFDVTVFNFFLLGGLSSGTSYILNMVFGDNGVKHEYKRLDE